MYRILAILAALAIGLVALIPASAATTVGDIKTGYIELSPANPHHGDSVVITVHSPKYGGGKADVLLTCTGRVVIWSAGLPLRNIGIGTGIDYKHYVASTAPILLDSASWTEGAMVSCTATGHVFPHGVVARLTFVVTEAAPR